ncbi:MAG: aminoacetone oxidase family FAD-binding enzyme [Lachnospiraceae bacterium]|nr:aminoacetone oxidase family FAD-binding enzyme [Lachnospiraceae bacterium]
MDIGIIGGGASGMILASKLNKHNVTILEKNNKLGKKLLLTGNGKCNFTNMDFNNLDYIYNCKFAKTIFKRYDNYSFIEYLNSLGIVSKVETHKNIDYVYPNNNKSTSIYYALYDKIINNKINIEYNSNVINIIKKNNKFFVYTIDNKNYEFDILIFAFGGSTYAKTGSDGSCFSIVKKLGLTVNDVLPGLTPLKYKIDNIDVNKINFTGFRVDAYVSIKDKDNNVLSEYGEIQFTKENVSGIPILNLSSKLARIQSSYKNDIDIIFDFSCNLVNSVNVSNKSSYFNLSYEEKNNKVINILKLRRNLIPYKKIDDFLCGYLPDELNLIITSLLNLKNKKVSDLTDDDLINISNLIISFKIKIIKQNNYENAQISVGGIDTNEFYENSLEAKKIKGLYAIGEALDIDGICGGYNLQMCYSSASVVSNHILNMEG